MVRLPSGRKPPTIDDERTFFQEQHLKPSTMKFCKNLQRVADVSDPEWAPYWPNYKMLKKLIKELPSLVPSDDHKSSVQVEEREGVEDSNGGSSDSRANFRSSAEEGGHESGVKQQRGDRTTESDDNTDDHHHGTSTLTRETSGGSAHTHPQHAGSMTKSPGEVAFFKLLHAEFRKVSHFFDRATDEFTIREERVREGMNIMKQPNSIMVNDKWSLMAKSIYRLYRDLLLLETFAIMTYCSFSKILKKHDKVTGYSTKCAFMSNIVNKANFTNYPVVLQMINRCERLYEEVSHNLLQEGKGGLYEDERLFINMIHRLNEQVLNNDKDEVHMDRVDAVRRPVAAMPSSSKNESRATSTLREIVEEHEQSKVPTKVADTAQPCLAHDSDSDCDGEACRKRPAVNSNSPSPSKKQRT